MDLTKLMNEARDTPEQAECIAAIALELSRAQKAIERALGPLKEKLREIAVERRSGDLPSTVRIPGVRDSLVGEVTVTFPTTQVKVVGKADMDSLEATLGTELFSKLFERVVSYRPTKEFQENLPDPLGNPQRVSEILGVVKTVNPTPRVGFKPIPRDL